MHKKQTCISSKIDINLADFAVHIVMVVVALSKFLM